MTRTICNARSFYRTVAIVLPSLSAALLLAASAARADTMTYNVLSNPQPDITNGSPYEVDVSGTITVDNAGGSAIGTFDSSNDSGVSLDLDLTMSTTDPSVTPITVDGTVPLTTAFSIVTSSELYATATSLSIGSNSYLDLVIGGGMLGAPYMSVLYDTHDSPGYYNGYAGYQGPPSTMQFENTNAGGDYLVSGEWEIAAAVPEPATLTLFASALMGLGAVGLRRRAVGA